MPAKAPRLHFIDAARGATMLFVLVSHFGLSYFAEGDRQAVLIETVTLIASPTFMVISGLLIGYLYETRRDDFSEFRIAWLDRGVFLLTIGHALILLASWPKLHTARYLMITDAIGVSMIVSPAVVSRTSTLWRLVLSMLALAASWAIFFAWHPATGAVALAKAMAVGGNAGGNAQTFPLLAWWAADLAATVFGQRLGRLMQINSGVSPGRVLRQTGGALVLFALGGKGLYRMASVLAPHSVFAGPVAHMLTSPGMKFPPSPAYLCFYAGLGLCWLSAWSAAERRGIAPGARSLALAIGQSSLFVFLLQFFVYLTGVFLIAPHLPYRNLWPAYMLVSIVVIAGAAVAWHRAGYRRYLTVGIRGYWERRRLGAAEAEPLPAAPSMPPVSNFSA